MMQREGGGVVVREDGRGRNLGRSKEGREGRRQEGRREMLRQM